MYLKKKVLNLKRQSTPHRFAARSHVVVGFVRRVALLVVEFVRMGVLGRIFSFRFVHLDPCSTETPPLSNHPLSYVGLGLVLAVDVDFYPSCFCLFYVVGAALHFGLDIGGTLTKLAYFVPLQNKHASKKDEEQRRIQSFLEKTTR